MRARFRYYLGRGAAAVRADGALSALRQFTAFLVRRWFFLQLAWESLEFHLIAPRRSALATLRMATRGTIPLATVPRNLLLYSSFDAESRIHEHVIAQLRAYHVVGFCTIFITTSPHLTQQDIDLLHPWCAAILHRDNVGIDFGSWKTAYEWMQGEPEGRQYLGTLDTALLANDSCYGPFHDLAPFISRMRSAPSAVYGITKSLEIRPYLQSYFLHFGRDVVANGVFTQFMEHIRLLGTKLAVARYLEIGGSVFLDRRQVPLRALVDASEEPVREIMRQLRMADPIRDPAGQTFLQMRLTPFHKRSNDPFR
jgi:hypothetical protein